MQDWFHRHEINTDAATASSIEIQSLEDYLGKLPFGDTSWLPELPIGYQLPLNEKPPPKEPLEPLPKKKASQVRNTNMSPRFGDFKTNIENAKFNDVIKKHGAPPTVKRDGKDVPMCASYHLRGMCYSNCSRKADHVPLKKAEEDALYDWCKKALE